MRRRSDRRAVAVIAALLCLTGVAVAAHFQTQTNTSNGKRLASVAEKLSNVGVDAVFGCARLDVEVIQSNRAQFADYTLLKLSLRLSHASPTAAKVLTPALDAQGWIMPVNCKRTVEREGTHYKLPAPVPFSVALAPKRALTFPAGTVKSP